MIARNNAPRRHKKKAGPTDDIRERRSEEWLREDLAALDAYNEHVEKHGVFSDGLRSF